MGLEMICIYFSVSEEMEYGQLFMTAEWESGGACAERLISKGQQVEDAMN